MFFDEPFGGLIPGAPGAVLSALLKADEPLTGRQIHAMLSDDFSLWSVQQALKTLAQLGVIETRTVGRAGMHVVNEDHVAVAHLRSLDDPIAVLREAVADYVDSSVEAVIAFGPVARGEATENGGVDLAVIAGPSWDGRADLEAAVRTRVGNDCQVRVFTAAELADSGNPAAAEVVRDGVSLIEPTPGSRSPERSPEPVFAASDAADAASEHSVAEPIVRRARSLVELAGHVVRLGR